MRQIRLAVLVFALIALSFATSWAIPITLMPSVDVYWTSTSSTVPIDNASLLVGGGTTYSRSALKFDLSAIPDGSTINSATFYIYNQSYSYVSSLPVSQRRAVLSYSSDDTWTSSVIPAGGPAATTSLGNTSLTSPAAPNWRSWDLLAGGWNPLVDLVDDFLTLRLDPMSNPYRSSASFHSSTGVNSPYLLVDYTPVVIPAPATMLLFGTGLVGLAGSYFRKRKLGG